MAKDILQEIKRVTPITVRDSEGEAVDTQELFEMKSKAVERGAIKNATPVVPVKNSDPETAATPQIDLKAIEGMIAGAVTSAIAEVRAAAESEKQSALETQKQQAETEKNEIKSSLDEATEAIRQANEKIAALETKVSESERVISNFSDLGKLHGSSQPGGKMGVPNVNTLVQSNYDKLDGLFGEYTSFYESLPKRVHSSKNGLETEIADPRQLDNYVRQFGGISPENKLIMAAQEFGRRQGFFTGKKVRDPDSAIKQAATTGADLVGSYLPMLSSLMRMTHRPGYIFWQFPWTEIDFNQGQGDEIQVPRFAYLTSSSTTNDYKLSGKGTYADIVTTGDPLQSGIVSIFLEEWGRGKSGAGTSMSPVSIPSFVNFTSVFNLLAVLDRNLGMDYTRFEDKKIRELWAATSRIVYNDNNNVTTTAGNVGTGDKGTFTPEFADALTAYAWTNQIEPLPDNSFIYVHTVESFKQYRSALKTEWEPPTERDLQALTNFFNPTVIPPEDFARVQGYQGKYNNLHHFVSNSYATGAAGTEGVQNVTLGVGSTLTRSGYLAGANTIGRAQGMPMEIRQADETNFQRRDLYTWLSYEGFAAIDVDASGYSDTSTVPQQTRVIQVRTTDVAV